MVLDTPDGKHLQLILDRTERGVVMFLLQAPCQTSG